MLKLSFSPVAVALTLLSLVLMGAPASAQNRDSMLQFQLADQLKRSAAMWNRGDLEGFMGDYVQSEELTFTSGGRILHGFDSLKERYEKRYGGSRQDMGQLSFTEIEVWRLASDRALVLGRWKIDRPEAGETFTDNGVFSLIMLQIGSEWKIFHDHTSVAADR